MKHEIWQSTEGTKPIDGKMPQTHGDSSQKKANETASSVKGHQGKSGNSGSSGGSMSY